MSVDKRKSASIEQSIERQPADADLAVTHALFEQAEQLAGLGHYEWDDANRRLVACSRGYARILDMTVEEVLAEASEYEDDLNLIHPEDREHYAKALTKATGDGETLSAEYRVVTASGQVRHVREFMESEPSERNTFFGTLLDITEQKETEQALRDSHAVLNAIIEGTPDFIFVKDLDGRFTTLNSSAARKIGKPVDAIVGKTCFDLFSPEMAADTHKEDGEVLRAGRPLLFEHLSGRDDRVLSTTKYVYCDDQGRPMGIIGISRDITERIRAEERVRHLAYHDELTSLPSVRLAKDRLAGAIARARRENSNAALLYLDLDDFKKINDRMGHKAGDQVLITVGDRLTKCVRETDTVARVGGDEFIVVLTGERVAPVTVARKILSALERPILIEDHPVSINVSIGIAVYPGHGDTPDELIAKADQVMYLVKRRGKNSFSVA